jgi:hypothetical protein
MTLGANVAWLVKDTTWIGPALLRVIEVTHTLENVEVSARIFSSQ